MHGAKDMFGTVPTYPNTSPRILYYYATDSVYKANFGADTNRMDSINYNPFYMKNNTTLNLAFLTDDDSTSIANMHLNKLKISTRADDFTTPPIFTYTGTYLSFPPNEFHLVTINTGALPNSDTLFMRYYINDGDHVSNTEFPTTNLPFPYKTFFSFFIKP